MSLKKDLKKQIDEAIASDSTSRENKELLILIKRDLEKAKSEKQYYSLALKIIELIGALTKVFT